MKNTLNTLIVVLIFTACSKKSEDAVELKSQKTLLQYTSTIIDLDSLTGFYTPNLQQIEFENSECIALLNQLVNRIQVYNINTGEMVRHIDLDINGPNGVGEKPSAFFIQNLDSIFVFDSWSTNVTLVNHEGKRLGKFNLSPNGLNDGYPVPQGSTQRPIIFNNNELLMAGLLLPWEGLELNENQFIKYNINSKEIEYKVRRPNIYNEHNWGNSVMFHLNYSFNPNDKKYLFSFNNYDKLIVYDEEFLVREEYETQSVFFDKIEPYEEEFSYEWSADKLEKYNFLNPRFWSVTYDPYQKLTYRVALIPNPKESFNYGIRNMQVSIIILDENYERVGEFKLDRDKYDSRMMFVSSKGLHIANRSSFAQNEGKLQFDVFKLAENG